MTDIGELVVRIKADAADLERQLASATQSTRTASNQMSEALHLVKEAFIELLPALSVAALVEFGKQAVESAGHLGDLAEMIGFSASTLSAMKTILEQNGSSVDEFAASVSRMNAMIGEAAKGVNVEAVKAFDNLKLSVRKLLELNSEQRFFAIVQALSRIDDQGKLTRAGMDLFGRSFASMIPFVKQAGSNIQEFTKHQQEAGNALSDENIHRVREFGDALVAASEKAKNAFVDAFAEILKFYDKVSALSPPPGSYVNAKIGLTPKQLAENYINPNVSTQRPAALSNDQVAKKIREALKSQPNNATGSNADLLPPPPTNQVEDYIQSLWDEADALNKSELALAQYRAEKAAVAKAQEDFKNKLRDTADLTDEEKANIDAATAAYETQKKAIENLREEEHKHSQMVAQMEADIASSLADIAVSFKSLGDTVSSVLQQIAKQLIELKITTPLVEAIGGTKNSPGLLDNVFANFSFSKLLGFADGGSPPVGVPSIVGENGPELFVPNSAGTVVPNKMLGGSHVIVQQNIQVFPGVAETVDAKIREAAPYIAAQAHASVMQAARKGGAESKILGLRSN